MDVTPRELRDIDIREGFRGYNRDDVDELLERAAATIESLNERMRRLSEQVSSVEGQQGSSRETEDMLHRTLLLAQRAADEAVAEAQFKARQILDDAETKARAQVVEAESAARRQVETERRRLENEVLELGSRREALLADVDGLERFESEYRQRLRRALETDLESLAGQGPVAPSARPPIHEVDLPSAQSNAPSSPGPSSSAPSPFSAPPLPSPSASPQTPRPPSTDTGAPTAEIRGLGTWDPPSRAPEPASSAPSAPTPTPAPAPTPPPAPPSEPAADAPGANPAASSTPASTPTPAPSAPSTEPPAADAPRAPLFPKEPADAEPLDDEAFFASLREAVSDQSPLGPRDEVPDSTGTYEDDDARSGLFRRRR